MSNILKGWLTTIVGLIAIVITLVGIYLGKIDWVWNGLAGVTVGVVLILSPQTLEQKFLDILNKLTGSNKT